MEGFQKTAADAPPGLAAFCRALEKIANKEAKGGL
jgi:hypothetical protein